MIWATTRQAWRWNAVRLRTGVGRGAAGWFSAAMVVCRGLSRTSLRSESLSVFSRGTTPRHCAGRVFSRGRAVAEAAAAVRTAARATPTSAARGAGRSPGIERGYSSGTAVAITWSTGLTSGFEAPDLAEKGAP